MKTKLFLKAITMFILMVVLITGCGNKNDNSEELERVKKENKELKENQGKTDTKSETKIETKTDNNTVTETPSHHSKKIVPGTDYNYIIRKNGTRLYIHSDITFAMASFSENTDFMLALGEYDIRGNKWFRDSSIVAVWPQYALTKSTDPEYKDYWYIDSKEAVSMDCNVVQIHPEKLEYFQTHDWAFVNLFFDPAQPEKCRWYKDVPKTDRKCIDPRRVPDEAKK